MSMTYEEILRIRARDRQGVFVACLVAAILHLLAIFLIRFPKEPPRVLDVPPPENLVIIRRFQPAAPFPSSVLPANPGSAGSGASGPENTSSSISTDAVRVGPEGEPPSLIVRVEPDVPPALLRAKLRGVVVLDIVIRKDGSVGEITVRSGMGLSAYDEAAIQAVRRSRFAPATVQGVPVDALMTVEYRFS